MTKHNLNISKLWKDSASRPPKINESSNAQNLAIN